MDSVRFGRALGVGARGAARSLSAAVDAAAAPNPRQPAPSAHSPEPAPLRQAAAPREAASAARTTARAVTHVRKTREGVAQGSKRFGEALWGPFAKLSRVLWLEITGSFFGIFALFAGSAVWTHRADLRAPNHDARIHLLVFFVMTLVFAYFCISSFVRAYGR